MTSRNEIMAKWKKYLGKETYKVFDYSNRGEGEIESLEKMLKGGQEAVLEIENDLIEYNDEYIYTMFESELEGFILFESISDDEQELIKINSDLKDELRFEFEEHLDFNFETFYDYDILIFEKMYPVDYDGNQSKIDWKDSQSVAFRRRALKYITSEEFNQILINTYGGEGYIAAIVNGTELLTAITEEKKTIG